MVGGMKQLPTTVLALVAVLVGSALGSACTIRRAGADAQISSVTEILCDTQKRTAHLTVPGMTADELAVSVVAVGTSGGMRFAINNLLFEDGRVTADCDSPMAQTTYSIRFIQR